MILKKYFINGTTRTKNLYLLYVCTKVLFSEGIYMNQTEFKEKRDAEASNSYLSEFHMRSLDIDIAFYGTKLQKAKKTEF